MAKKKDTRDVLWARLEREIQSRGKNKDRSFRLSGRWKRFVRVQDGFKVYAVDGKWLRDNVCINFLHAGHGYVHEFIPLDEIWVSTHHYRDSRFVSCRCRNVRKDLKVSKPYFDSTVIHEITECRLMAEGTDYWTAHNIALKKEREIGLLEDPHSEVLLKKKKRNS
ncbi:hypothetical protein JW898_02075 [Candidatus Woesearchaeota archaeon]|nr:hypothetical protein [Candidatus Woesearchaeota archaeon]